MKDILLLGLTCMLMVSCQSSVSERQIPGELSQTIVIDEIKGETTPSGIQGMWVWRPDEINTDQAQDELLNFCERFGFNRLLVQIHQVDDRSPVYTIKYPRELTRLVAQATERGIKVEALDGANDMAFAANQLRSLEGLDALIDLNQSMPEGKRFIGVHYDIEPYTSDFWKSSQHNRDIAMLDLLTFYVMARQKLDDRGSGMLLACDIPMWYDTKTSPDDNCIVTFNGQTKNLHEHIQDLCDYVGIMSYRQNAVGPNSASEHIAGELAYAEMIGKQLCAALETVELKDTPEISFYGKSPDEFWRQVTLLEEQHAQRPGYAGTLLHCYRGLRNLLLDRPIRPDGSPAHAP